MSSCFPAEIMNNSDSNIVTDRTRSWFYAGATELLQLLSFALPFGLTLVVFGRGVGVAKA